MPLSPEAPQQAQGPGGQGRGHIGLEAHRPHLQIGVGGQVRQLPGERVVVPGDGVCRHQILPVGAEGPAVLQEVGKAGVLPGVVGRPGVHDPQAEAPDLVGKETLKVQGPGLAPVALQQHRPAQGVHRVADHAEQALEPGLPGQAAVVGSQGAVGLVLGHADIPGLHRRVRHEPGGAEEEHVAVEDAGRVHLFHRRQGVVLSGEADLVQLKLPPPGHPLPNVAHPDGGEDVPAHEAQADGQGAAHIPQSQQVDTDLLPGRTNGKAGVEQRLPPGVVQVDGPDPARRHGGGELRREGIGPVAQGGQRLHPLPGRQQIRVGRGEGLPARQGRAAEAPQDLPLSGQGRKRFIGQGLLRGQRVSLVTKVVHRFTLRSRSGRWPSAGPASRCHFPGRWRRPGSGRSPYSCPCPGTEAGSPPPPGG